MVNITINNIPVSVKKGTTILNAARSAGIHIPHLCYLKEINEIGQLNYWIYILSQSSNKNNNFVILRIYLSIQKNIRLKEVIL